VDGSLGDETCSLCLVLDKVSKKAHTVRRRDTKESSDKRCNSQEEEIIVESWRFTEWEIGSLGHK